jgi:hypothetical protein
VQAQYFEAPFLNAITPPTKAPSQPQVVQYVPFFVIVVLRLTQMPWKLVVLVEQMQRLVVPLAARLVHHQSPHGN